MTNNEKHPNPLLKLSHLSKQFGIDQGVFDASLKIFPGEILAIVGPSGCGKSTLLKLISGFETPDSGQVELNGININSLPPEKRGIGMVFQDYALFPNMNAFNNVVFALHQEKDKNIKRSLANDYLQKLNMQSYGDRYPYQLSGGQQQRVAIARTLAARPDLILLDEPFSSIDESTRTHARQEIREVLRLSGVSVIMVTHDCKEALSFADKVCVMQAGKMLQIDTPEAMYFHPKNAFVANFMAACNIISAKQQQGVLSCCLGQFTLELAPECINDTENIKISIRPESLLLSPVNKTDSSATLGIIIRQEFTGDAYFYSIKIGTETLLVRSSQKYAINQSVTLAITSTEALVILGE